MAYTLDIEGVEVEALDAKWQIGPADELWADLGPYLMGMFEKLGPDAELSLKISDMPPELLNILGRIKQHIVGWTGVVNKVGEPVEFTAERALQIPPLHAWSIGAAYLGKTAAYLGNVPEPVEQPT